MTATDSKRVIYNVLEYSPLCDSSNMTMDDWIRIAHDIKVTSTMQVYIVRDAWFNQIYIYIVIRPFSGMYAKI